MMKKIYHRPIETRCEVQAALNFGQDTKDRIGHLVKLSFIAQGIDLVADMALCDPQNPNIQIPSVGLISCFYWESVDLFHLVFYISPQNRGIVQEVIFTSNEQVEIGVEFVIYEYDYFEKKYFQQIHSNKKLIKCKIQNQRTIRIEEEMEDGWRKIPFFCIELPLAAINDKEIQEIFYRASPSTPTHIRKLTTNHLTTT